MMGSAHLRVGRLADLDQLGSIARTPAIFLSASQPEPRYEPGDARYERNRRHVATARPELIRAAVVELCKWMFRRRYVLVFGGHPAITPVVLEAARRFGESSPVPQVFVFQSEVFPETARPRATHELVTWDVGQLVLTPEEGPLDTSLGRMRDIMVRWPGVRAGVFIGGMDGILDEAQRFQHADRDAGQPRPAFAVASTGGAALDVMESYGFAGLGRRVPRDQMRRLLSDNESYALVMREIFLELGDEAAPTR